MTAPGEPPQKGPKGHDSGQDTGAAWDAWDEGADREPGDGWAAIAERDSGDAPWAFPTGRQPACHQMTGDVKVAGHRTEDADELRGMHVDVDAEDAEAWWDALQESEGERTIEFELDLAAADRAVSPQDSQDACTVPGSPPAAYPGWQGAAETLPLNVLVPGDVDEALRTTQPTAAVNTASRYDPPTTPMPYWDIPGSPRVTPVPPTVTASGPETPDHPERPDGPAPGRPPEERPTPGGPPPGGRQGPGGPAPGGGAPGAPGGPYGGGPGGGPGGYGNVPGGQPPGYPPPPGPPPGGWPPPRPAGGGLATTALVLGIAGILLLPIFGIGLPIAILGLILGIVATVKGVGRGRAIAGIVLSLIAIVLAIIAMVWFANRFGECLNLPTQDLVQRCLERKLGVTSPAAP
ncbi:DUF4190 domain-containing protein [Sinosporangium siamense]|uniref:DUF4190 domain-containing protein n=1 Tax=Sinosporangium siamense TaxID=1367973 RepID=A0A919RLZ1_9ACTN|nr:DUF4190 domain-containing protein [Sinosporangium siamense]GII96246.1 hypothetical protein Ssi02_64770 [Sinosporangium siamense]